MDRIKLRKFEKIIATITYFIVTLAIGFAVLMITSFINKEVFYMLSQSKIYAIVITAIALRNAVHFYKWYVKSSPINIQCPQCHTKVILRRYKEHELLSSPIILYIETFQFQLIRLKQYFYLITYRPYLQLDCPECGKNQVICPYCHEPLSIDAIKCEYNKPSKCPHCGRRIYTLLPLQDCDKHLIKIKDIAN